MRKIPRRPYKPRATSPGQPVIWRHEDENYVGTVWSAGPYPRSLWVHDVERHPDIWVVLSYRQREDGTHVFHELERYRAEELRERERTRNPNTPQPAKTGTDDNEEM